MKQIAIDRNTNLVPKAFEKRLYYRRQNFLAKTSGYFILYPYL